MAMRNYMKIIKFKQRNRDYCHCQNVIIFPWKYGAQMVLFESIAEAMGPWVFSISALKACL